MGPHISMCGVTSLDFGCLDFRWPDATFVYCIRFRFRSESESSDFESDSASDSASDSDSDSASARADST